MTVNNSNFTLDTVEVCDSIFWNGNIYTSSGNYTDTLQTASGCDSVVTINLTVHNSISTIDSITTCDSAIWNGNVYITSGVYVDTLETIDGWTASLQWI